MEPDIAWKMRTSETSEDDVCRNDRKVRPGRSISKIIIFRNQA